MFGWIRQKKDNRDFKSAIHLVDNREKIKLPKAFLLETNKIYNQAELGSCTANMGSLMAYYETREKNLATTYDPSRLYLYYNTRVLQGTIGEDSGADIRNVFKSINEKGICNEKHCKYDIKKFTKRPSARAYKDGAKHQVLIYATVPQEIEAIKLTLYSKTLVGFGFDVYDGFMKGDWHKKGFIMPLPKSNEKIIGGHAVTIVGWDDKIQCFIIQNSWGSEWADHGRFYMPYRFLTSNSCSDFWCITAME